MAKVPHHLHLPPCTVSFEVPPEWGLLEPSSDDAGDADVTRIT